MPNCKARYTRYEDRLYFADGKHRFFLESYCGEPCDGDMCIKCADKNQSRIHYYKSYDHGVVDGPYLEKSQLYDTPYYHASILKFGAPSQTDLERAMEAQRRARAKLPRETNTNPVENTVASVPTSTPTEDKKRARGRPKSSAKAIVEAAPELIQETPVPEKTKPKPKPRLKPTTTKEPSKKAEVVVAKPQQATVVHTLPKEGMVETMDDPLIVRDVVRIVLKPFTHGSAKYWRDSDREKLYSCTKDGKRGSYVGRWDSTNNCIVKDAYDSDED